MQPFLTLAGLALLSSAVHGAVALDDKQAAPGETLILNFVQLKPYLEPKD